MKRHIKMLSLLLFLAMMLSSLAVFATFTASAAPSAVTGTSSLITEKIYIGNTDTGVRHTQMKLTSGSLYAPAAAGVLNVVEINGNTGAHFQVINNGTYNYSKTTVGKAAVDYNNSHKNATVIASVNATPWFMTSTDYDGDGVKSTGPSVKAGGSGMPMAFMMIDGEIWNTTTLDDENYLDTSGNHFSTVNGVRTPNSYASPVFIAYEDGTCAIESAPLITVTVRNTANRATLRPDGINRLPGPNSMIAYNKRVYDQSLGYEDAYEVYLECNSSAFKIGETLTGTVTAVYRSGQTGTRPAIGANTIVISARGTAINDITDGEFAVGDSVTVKCTQRSGRTLDNATQAIGGFFSLVENGVKTGQQSNSSAYPCCFVGVRADGSAALVSITSQTDGVYRGSKMKNLSDLCLELGFKDALLFDGGGSATMITLEDGAYLRRTACSDGTNSVRSVINSLAIVYDGLNVNATYSAGALKYLDGVQNTNPQAPADPTDNPTEKPTDKPTEPPVEVITEQPDIKAAPSSSYRYAGIIDFINGTGPDGSSSPYQGLNSYRNSTVTTPTVPSVWEIDAAADNTLGITGWALVNGGQGGWYWSVDNYNWFKCSASGPVDMSNYQAILAAATSMGELTSTSNCEANSKFSNIKADLTPWAGTTIPTVYFATSTKSGQILTILQVNNVEVLKHECVPGPAASCTTPQTCTVCGKVLQPAYNAHVWPERICTQDWVCSRCGLTAAYAKSHSWRTAYEYNESGHWHDCADCASISDVEAHVFTGGVCVCGYERACEHTNIVTIAARAATCEATGLTEGAKCSDCGQITKEQQTIPALGHKWTAANCETPKTCSVCGKTEGAALGHKWTAANCTTPKTCSVCNATEGAALGHKWTAANCTTPKTCSVCKTTEGAALGHNWVYDNNETEHWRVCTRCNETKDSAAHDISSGTCVCGYGCAHKNTEIIPKVDATCTDDGATEGEKCADCEKILKAPEKINALGHKFTNATCTTPKTCSVCNTTQGNALGHNWVYKHNETQHWRECTRCNETKDRVQHNISSGQCVCGYGCAHKNTEIIPKVDATCTESGTTQGSKCSDCGKVLNVPTKTDPLGHSEVAIGEAKDANCTEDGITAGVKCSVCGTVITAQEQIPAIGHDEISHSGKAATCTEDGYNDYVTCSRCEYTTYEQITANGHTFGDEATCTTAQVCTICNEEIVAALGHTKGAGATCTEPQVCTVCGEVIVEAYGHTWSSGYKVNENAHWHECIECYEKDTEQEHAYTDGVCICGCECLHSSAQWAVVSEATCSSEGSKVQTCNICGKTVDEQIIQKIEHTWTAANCETPKTCSVCNATDGEALGHTWTAATCETPKTCSVCDVTEGEALGHTWTVATCEAPKTCSVCNATDGEALGHNWTAATCTTLKTCSVCKKTEGETLNHTWTGATCDAPKTCSVCNATEGDVLGHSFGEYISDKNATCTSDGTKTAVCGRCDATDTVTDIGSMTEHTFDNEKDAICNVCGYEREIATTPTTDKPEEKPTDVDEKQGRGCKSAIGASAFAIIGTVALAGYSLIKKQKD